ncbi:MAG TPA: hypothetical protein VEJ16_13945 [Alphaproteobacteria bacterium]|nr:hypothetical protein [Alphaproteobacteria bacterium]
MSRLIAIVWLLMFAFGLVFIPAGADRPAWAALNVLAAFLVGAVSDEWEERRARKMLMKAEPLKDKLAREAADLHGRKSR